MVNWTMATSICYSIHSDAHLVSLETKNEQDWVAKRWRNEVGEDSFSQRCKYRNESVVSGRGWRSFSLLDKRLHDRTSQLAVDIKQRTHQILQLDPEWVHYDYLYFLFSTNV